MWGDFFSFYWTCLRRAFSGRFWLIEKWTGGLGLLTLLAGKLLSPPEAYAEMIEVDLPMYFFLVIFIGTIIVGFILAPFHMHSEELHKRKEMEELRRPKLSVSLANTSGVQVFSGGTSEEFFSGKRQTSVSLATPSALCLVVKNSGEVRLDPCMADLISAECVEGDKIGKIEIFEPITLSWDPIHQEDNLIGFLESNVHRRVWIAYVTSGGFVWIYRNRDKLPVDYQQVFGPAGRYHAVIQVSDGISASIQTKIETIGRENGVGSIAILEQGLPRL